MHTLRVPRFKVPCCQSCVPVGFQFCLISVIDFLAVEQISVPVIPY